MSPELFEFTHGTYIDERFKIRVNRFSKEEELLSPYQVKSFYEKITHKQMDLLFELLDKTRTATYDLHAKILAKLYVNLLKNGDFNYFESSLLANISTLAEDDFFYFYKIIWVYKHTGQKKITIRDDAENYERQCSVNKFIQIGLFSLFTKEYVNNDTSDENTIRFSIIESSFKLFDILEEVLDQETKDDLYDKYLE